MGYWISADDFTLGSIFSYILSLGTRGNPGVNVRPRLWETWYRNEVELRRESPNVHNLFLWSLESQENDENADMLPVTRFSPWRPVN